MPLPAQHSPLLRYGQFCYKPEKKYLPSLRPCTIFNCTHTLQTIFLAHFNIWDDVLCYNSNLYCTIFKNSTTKCMQDYKMRLLTGLPQSLQELYLLELVADLQYFQKNWNTNPTE